MNYVAWVAVCFGVLLLASSVCCERGQSQTIEPAESTESAESTEQTESPVETVVNRIVFVGQGECCDCTQDRIDASWEALSAAIEGQSIEVERLQRDTQQAEASVYQEMRAIMVIPAIYFFDSEGNLVEQLQGEVTTEQIQSVIQ